ncbi:unnamed protein product [Amoebophrya sp. A25]|nr:unnamed protein product [Amoebophrya sp. A25]|eukprot:GSA25T00018174001.1
MQSTSQRPRVDVNDGDAGAVLVGAPGSKNHASLPQEEERSMRERLVAQGGAPVIASNEADNDDEGEETAGVDASSRQLLTIPPTQKELEADSTVTGRSMFIDNLWRLTADMFSSDTEYLNVIGRAIVGSAEWDAEMEYTGCGGEEEDQMVVEQDEATTSSSVEQDKSKYGKGSGVQKKVLLLRASASAERRSSTLEGEDGSRDATARGESPLTSFNRRNRGDYRNRGDEQVGSEVLEEATGSEVLSLKRKQMNYVVEGGPTTGDARKKVRTSATRRPVVDLISRPCKRPWAISAFGEVEHGAFYNNPWFFRELAVRCPQAFTLSRKLRERFLRNFAGSESRRPSSTNVQTGGSAGSSTDAPRPRGSAGSSSNSASLQRDSAGGSGSAPAAPAIARGVLAGPSAWVLAASCFAQEYQQIGDILRKHIESGALDIRPPQATFSTSVETAAMRQATASSTSSSSTATNTPGPAVPLHRNNYRSASSLTLSTTASPSSARTTTSGGGISTSSPRRSPRSFPAARPDSTTSHLAHNIVEQQHAVSPRTSSTLVTSRSRYPVPLPPGPGHPGAPVPPGGVATTGGLPGPGHPGAPGPSLPANGGGRAVTPGSDGGRGGNRVRASSGVDGAELREREPTASRHFAKSGAAMAPFRSTNFYEHLLHQQVVQQGQPQGLQPESFSASAYVALSTTGPSQQLQSQQQLQGPPNSSSTRTSAATSAPVQAQGVQQQLQFSQNARPPRVIPPPPRQHSAGGPTPRGLNMGHPNQFPDAPWRARPAAGGRPFVVPPRRLGAGIYRGH